MSAITLLGTPAEIYVFGTQYCTAVLAYPFVMYVVGKWFVPVYFKLNISTSYEVNKLRLIGHVYNKLKKKSKRT